jgi:DNA-binding response OmpR family regulator
VSRRIALVETDPVAARELVKFLDGAGYRVSVHASLGKFLDALLKQTPDVLLMNMHLPGMEGREIIRALRANPQTKRMILVGLSDRPRSKDESAAAFTAGADEYFFKPLDPAMFAARLASLLRGAPEAPADTTINHAGIAVCPVSRTCRLSGQEVRLTRLEFDILLQFIRNPNRVLTRRGLIDALWSGDAARGSRAVDRHVSALRGKLGSYGALLETLVGIGYRLADAPLKNGPAARK